MNEVTKMQVSVETTNGLERRMTVAVPADRVEREVENRLKSLSRTAKLAGFRPGKVPMKVISSKYGPQVRKEVLDEVMQQSFQEAVMQEKLQPAGSPRIESRLSESGKDFEYTAVFEVYPGIELTPLNNIEIQKPVAEITESDVDNMLEKLRKQQVEWRAAERPAELEDQIVIDFRGTIDGKDFEGNEGNDVSLVLGSGSFIADFEKQLVGTKTGDRKTVELTFPDDYRAKDLAGQKAQFDVMVHSVATPHLPEIDENFIRSYGVKGDGIDALRQEVRESMATEMEQAVHELIKAQALDKLHAANPIDVPQALVDAEIANQMTQTRNNLMNQGVTPDQIKLERGMFEERARRRVAFGLLVSEIVKQQNFKADAPRVRQKIEWLAASYDQPEEVIKWYYADRNRLSQIETAVLEDQVVDWILEHATVTENTTTFDDIMKERQA